MLEKFLINFFIMILLPFFTKKRDRRGEIKREPPLSQQSSGGVMLDRNGEEKKQGTPATSSTRVSVVWDHENSTGFDADTSKVGKPFFSFFF